MPAKRTGKYVGLSVEKKQQIAKTFNQPKEFTSLTAIANHHNVSRNTVKKLLDNLVSVGRISEQNHLLKPSAVPPKTRAFIQKRRLGMIKFIEELSQKGRPVSVNLLQKTFGGQKSVAKKVLEFVEKKLAKTDTPVIRRTKSSQPRRK
jgi:hypothetical protein